MSLTRRVLALATPAFAALVAHPLMLLADTWVVGRLGTRPLAGLGIGSSVLLTVVGLCVFLAYSSTAVVARQVGAGNRRRGLELGVQAMWLAGALGAAVAVLLWPGAAWLSRGLGAGPDVLGHSVTYLRFSLPGLPGMLVMLAATGTFRGLADARTPLVLSLTTAGLNLVLNLAFVFGLGLGIAGAGLATATAETALGLAAAALVAARARRLGARLRLCAREIRDALVVGAPLWLRTLTLRAALLLTTSIAASQGAAGLAAHHVTMNVWNFLAHALDAIAIAGQTIIAQGLGAGDAADVRASSRLMLRWSIGAGAVLGVATVAARVPIAQFFSTDAQVRSHVSWLLVIAGVSLALAGYVYLLDGVLIGAGDGPYLAKAGVVTLAFYVPLACGALLAPAGLPGLAWLWVSFTVGFMGARAITLGLRASGEQWIRLGS